MKKFKQQVVEPAIMFTMIFSGSVATFYGMAITLNAIIN